VSPTAPPEATTDLRTIIPLHLGNSWQYSWTHSDDSVPLITTTDTIEIVDTLSFNGQQYFKYHGIPPHFFADSNRTYYETISSTDYSVYTWVEGASAQGGLISGTGQWLPLHVLQTPLVKGHRWPCAEWSSLYDTMMIVNPDTMFVDPETGDTTYHAIYVARSWDLQYEIVPGIGVIHQLESPALDSYSWMRILTCHLN